MGCLQNAVVGHESCHSSDSVRQHFAGNDAYTMNISVRILENFGTYANAFLSGPSQVIVSSRLSVSTFFLIGGILVTYHGLKRLDLNQPGKKIIAMYIKRYIR